MREVARSLLWKNFNVLQIFAANTDVGKTVFATHIARKLIRETKDNRSLIYLKPVTTGSSLHDDAGHLSKFCPQAESRSLYSFDTPVSPHLAAAHEGKFLRDAKIRGTITDELEKAAKLDFAWGIVETAGGVLSPTPSGSLQADLYRPLRLPVILIGDHRLGGIATTISAYESLILRGFDVDAILLFRDSTLNNHRYLRQHFKDNRLRVYAVRPPPQLSQDTAYDRFAMQNYYLSVERETRDELLDWYNYQVKLIETRRLKLQNLAHRAHQTIWHPFMQHSERTARDILTIDSAYGDDFQVLRNAGSSEKERAMLVPRFDGSASWWTQGLGHGNPKMALEAAYAAGRYGHVMFANAAHEPAVALAEKLLEPTRHLKWQREGHDRHNKVFYSDNGSTGMEVAVKMALKTSAKIHGWKPDDDIKIFGLVGSYHGDTVGVMNCSEPNIYNERVEWYDANKGVWLDFPKVKMKGGRWHVVPPPGTENDFGASQSFTDLSAIFDYKAREEQNKKYHKALKTLFSDLAQNDKIKFGALIIEPIILGAGGMHFVDPLFQRALVNEARRYRQPLGSSNMSGTQESKSLERQQEDVPATEYKASTNQNEEDHDARGHGDRGTPGMTVICDEVFTGMYRLGVRWSSDLLQVMPDIRVTAKLLTGGLLPLAATTARQPIFEAFLSDEKADALLHGHSYTAHAVGCQVALSSIEEYERLDSRSHIPGLSPHSQKNGWAPFKRDWTSAAAERKATDLADQSDVSGLSSPARRDTSWLPWSAWSNDFVTKLSFRDDVEGVFALGFVLAIEIRDDNGKGYTSTASHGIRDRLLQGSPDSAYGVHCRVLGNVLYFMASLSSQPHTLERVQTQIEWAMDA